MSTLPEKKPAKTPNPASRRAVKETPEGFRARQNLRLLSEVYRSHWELFLKGFALYLAACSALTGVAAAHPANKPLGLFCAVALAVGSIIAIGATFIAVSFMRKTKERVDHLSSVAQYESFMTSDTVRTIVLLRCVAIFVCLAAVVQALFVFGILDFSWLK
jgi:hypothetical protein